MRFFSGGILFSSGSIRTIVLFNYSRTIIIRRKMTVLHARFNVVMILGASSNIVYQKDTDCDFRLQTASSRIITVIIVFFLSRMELLQSICLSMSIVIPFVRETQ